MKVAICAVLLSIVFGGFGLQSETSAEHALDGSFVTKSLTYNNKPYKISGMFVAKKMWFKDGKFKTWTDQNEFSGTYTLDDSKNPKWITLQYDGDTPKPFQGTSFRGLYDVDEDKLTLVFNVQRRPKSLSSEKHSLDYMYVFEKEKPKDKEK